MRKHEERPITTSSIPAEQIHSDPSTSYSITAGREGYDMKYVFLAERYKDDRYAIIKTVAFVREKGNYIDI
jgi:hypothetical protein